MKEIWYRLKTLPDLTLNRYSALEENGVDGVLEKHTAFLRQLNRKGLICGLSFHLFYLYLKPEDPALDRPGSRLEVMLMVRGQEENLRHVDAMMRASPLSDFYSFQGETPKGHPMQLSLVLRRRKLPMPEFSWCSGLLKTESLLPSSGTDQEYYLVRDWEMNEDGRLYNLCKMMEALDRTALYRVDLYPCELSERLRRQLRGPMDYLRRRRDSYSHDSRRDQEGQDTLKNYEDLLEKFESSPHFIANILAFAPSAEEAATLVDAAGSESLQKGKYSIGTFRGRFTPMSFLDEEAVSLRDPVSGIRMTGGNPGLVLCREDTAQLQLNFLPTLFSLEEAGPFFRFPALYDGEVIQLPKETAPKLVDEEGSIYLGRDKNGYRVNFPLKLLPKHAFISGVPGSGKTNTMHHITSSLYQKGIPFLVMEPAKQEYRALLNDPGMQDIYLFSPNADMSFPLHVNPFEMPVGTIVAEHIRRLCEVFEGAFPLEPPMPFLLDNAIEAVYREAGWIPEMVYDGLEGKGPDGKPKQLPTMSMLYRRLEQELRTTRYSEEVRGNLESALQVRIGSLLRREMGDVFDVSRSTLKPEKWLQVSAVVELESMGRGPANFMTLMLCSLIRETLKIHPDFAGPIRHVLFIEEAHNLIGPESEEQSGLDADPKQAATAFIVKMLAEVRALKEGIVIADQLPTVMAQEVLKNTGLKIGLRITSSDDRSLLGSTMAASPLQLENMATFPVGAALIFYEGLMRPFEMRIQEWCAEIRDGQEKHDRTTSKNDRDLRIALRNNDCYREINQISFRITLAKLVAAMKENRKSIDGFWKLLRDAQTLKKSIEEQTGILEAASLGRIPMTEQVRQIKWDELLRCENSYDAFLGTDTQARELMAVIAAQGRVLGTAERLKKGRWSRLELSEEDRELLWDLEITVCHETLKLHKSLPPKLADKVTGADPGIREMRAILEQLLLKNSDGR